MLKKENIHSHRNIESRYKKESLQRKERKECFHIKESDGEMNKANIFHFEKKRKRKPCKDKHSHPMEFIVCLFCFVHLFVLTVNIKISIC